MPEGTPLPNPSPTPPPAPGATPAPASTPVPAPAPVLAGAVSGAPAAPTAPAVVPGVALVPMAEFQKIQLRTAQVLEARPHPKADRLVILRIQVGEKVKQIVAGIRLWYAPETLAGRTIVVVDNLEPAKLRGELSEGMLLAVRLPDGGLRLLTTDGPAPSGLAVS